MDTMQRVLEQTTVLNIYSAIINNMEPIPALVASMEITKPIIQKMGFEDIMSNYLAHLMVDMMEADNIKLFLMTKLLYGDMNTDMLVGFREIFAKAVNDDSDSLDLYDNVAAQIIDDQNLLKGVENE